jgi:hypothetical protein
MLILIEVVLIGFVAWVRNRNQKLLFWMILFLGASILTLLRTTLDIPWLHRIQTLVLWPAHCFEDISLWYLLLYLLDLDRPTAPDARQAAEAAVAFGQEDDITVITLTRLATGVKSTTSLLMPELINSAA